MPDPFLSIVAPAHNEEENIPRLVDEVERAARATVARATDLFLQVSAPSARPPAERTDPTNGSAEHFEFILVDDGSTDSTRARALELARTRPWLRVIGMSNTPPGKGNGQSAAFHAGFRACRGHLVAVLDADLQNDPADLVRMIELMHRENADMVQGDRSANRRDNIVRRAGSIVGRAFRRLILADTIRDTGCSLRLMKREIALRLPLEFRGVHRFIPVSARHMGYKVVEMPVTHRPRIAGETKYGMGVLTRALPGLIDCFAVRWMKHRRRPVTSEELKP
jgi:dolichol-phosphate mannosyltransferase